MAVLLRMVTDCWLLLLPAPRNGSGGARARDGRDEEEQSSRQQISTKQPSGRDEQYPFHLE